MIPALGMGAAFGVVASAWVTPALAALGALAFVAVIVASRLLETEWRR